MCDVNSFPLAFPPTSKCIILTPGPFAEKRLLFLQEIGQCRILKTDHETYREATESYLLVSVQDGRGEMIYDGQKYPLAAGDCFYIDCRKIHSYRSSMDAPWEVLWAHFNGCSAKGYYDLFQQRSQIVFRSVQKGRIDQLLEEMLALNIAGGPEAELHNARLLTTLVTMLVTNGHIATGKGADCRTTLASVREYLAEYCVENHTLDELAERFYISKYHLSHEFKRIYNETPMEFLLHQRLTKAKMLLHFTNQSIAEIAEACGFSDPSYFNRQFHRVEGCSASEYKRRWQE